MSVGVNLDLLASLSEDRALAIATFFGPEHSDPTPPFHLEMLDLWASADELVLIEGFRQSAKTTLALEFLTLEGLFGNYRFALFIADKYDKACEKLEEVKRHVKGNRDIRALFGNQIGDKDREDVFHLKNGARIQAMGREQSPRGLLHHTARPDRIYIDDVENKERGDVASTQAVDATIRWLYADVLPAMDKNSGKARVNATPLARDCLVSRIKADSTWTSRSYPIVSGDIDSDDALALWPERYPLPWVRRERDKFAKQGMLTQFNQEYLCVSEEESEKILPVSSLIETEWNERDWTPCYATFDPARTTKKTSNLTGSCVFSWMGSSLSVIESWGESLRPSQIMERIFAVNETYFPIGIGVESNSLEEFLMEPLRMEMLRRRVQLPLVELRAPQVQSKQDFIKGLQPYLAAGQIELVGGKTKHARLIQEMAAFPSKNDDVLNALAYALRMRAGQAIYEDFSAENIAQEAAPVRGQPVYLAFNASGKETTCVAVQLVGQSLTILEEWVIPGDMNDAVEQIRLAAGGIFARDRVLVFVPADLHDDWARLPLIRVLRANRLQPGRGSYIRLGAGVLSSYIRTTIRASRALLVRSSCRQTINALAGGYALPVGPTGRASEEPVENAYKTLVQGVESLTHTLNHGLSSPATEAHYATSPEGQRFITSRPGVSFRRPN